MLTSQLLPLDARLKLMRAAKVEDPDERAKAVQAAIDWARNRYPEKFRPCDENCQTTKSA